MTLTLINNGPHTLQYSIGFCNVWPNVLLLHIPISLLGNGRWSSQVTNHSPIIIDILSVVET